MAIIAGPTAEKIGFALCRVVVPLWILTGAVFKLIERTPSNLPGSIVAAARDVGIDLGLLLRTLIGLELVAVVVMVLFARWARPVAIFMLGVFCAILVVELLRNAQSCGCFGKIKLHPGVMLGIDGTLLLGVILFAPRRVEKMPKAALPAALAAIVLTSAASFGVPDKQTEAPPGGNGGNGNGGAGNGGVVAEGCAAWPELIPIPGFWYASDLEEWPGRCWHEIDLFQIIRDKPRDIAEGRKIIVFYRRDCDHCEEMFHSYFLGQLTDGVIAYRIASEVDWPMPADVTAQLIDLTDQCDWVVETPLVIVLEDGKVVCAREGEGFEECLQ